MGVIFKIALRNLKEHKDKTLIIGIIITLGIMILVVGNSFIDTATAGIRKIYIDNFTGDLIITASSKQTLFGNMDPSRMTEGTPKIQNYFAIMDYLKTIPEVKAINPQLSGFATAQFGDKGMGFMMLFGIEPDLYRKAFPDNLELISGDWLQQGEPGLMLSENGAKMLEEEEKQAVKPGDKLLLSSIGGSSGTSIRELEVKGIFRFKSSNAQLNMVSIIDIGNMRALAGMTEGAAAATTQAQLTVTKDDDDALFGGDDETGMVETVTATNGARSEESLLSILGDTTERDRLSSIDTGAWHFIIVKLASQDQYAATAQKLTRYFEENNIEAFVSNWRQGAGTIAEISYYIKLAFNVLILIIAIVAILIIMNTIVISVLERIPEIGTMRALGAHRSFVRSLITTETVIISGLFGLAGLLIGALIIFYFNMTGITASNMIFETLFGGKVLRPILTGSSVIISLLIAVGAGFVASLYPVSIALKVKPVKAIQVD